MGAARHAKTYGERLVRHAMDAHGGMVYLVALSQTHSHADAQDVSQDVFMRLLVSDVAFACDDHLRAWLLRVTVNRCRELHRSAWRRRVVSNESGGLLAIEERTTARLEPDPADAAVAALERSQVWQALKALPEELRIVALLHYVDECPTKRIAQIVDCPVSTVRTRLHRARKRMRDYLKDKEEDHGQE